MNCVSVYMQKNSTKDNSKKGDAPAVEVPQHIGRKLKEMYDYIAEQPVPDRFKDLLDQLEKNDKSVQTS